MVYVYRQNIAEYFNLAPRCLKSLQVLFLTRLSFTKTPADLWKDKSNQRVTSDSWLNLQH